MFKFVVPMLLFVYSAAIAAQTPLAGELTIKENGQTQIWNGFSSQWTSVDTFWMDYANSKGGLTWGISTTYPEYDKVNEHDTLIIKIDNDTCLMEFFHGRWRRANDVRRWNDNLNQYSACARVFN